MSEAKGFGIFHPCIHINNNWFYVTDLIDMLKERYNCPYFRILVIGRANAGKTTILEKICGVEKGTKPIVYHQGDVDLKGNLNLSYIKYV